MGQGAASRLRLMASLAVFVLFAASRADKAGQDEAHASTASPRGEIHDCWAQKERDAATRGVYGSDKGAATLRPCCADANADRKRTGPE